MSQWMRRAPTSIDLAIPRIVQETPVWCWAAVTQMVVTHFGQATAVPSQREIVRMALGHARDARWQNGIPEEAIVPNDAHFIRLMVRLLSRRASDWFPACSAEELYANLYFGNVVILHLRISETMGHVVVVAGARPADGGYEILVNDPEPRVPAPFWTRYEAVAPAILQHMVIYRDIRA
jgi:hypothetical protein